MWLLNIRVMFKQVYYCTVCVQHTFSLVMTKIVYLVYQLCATAPVVQLWDQLIIHNPWQKMHISEVNTRSALSPISIR